MKKSYLTCTAFALSVIPWGFAEEPAASSPPVSAAIAEMTVDFSPPIPPKKTSGVKISLLLQSNQSDILYSSKESKLYAKDSTGANIGEFVFSPLNLKPFKYYNQQTFKPIGEKRHELCMDLESNKLPSSGAEWVSLQGNVDLAIAKETETLPPVTLPLKPGETATVSGITVTIGKGYAPEADENREEKEFSRAIVLSGPNIYLVKSVILKDENNTIISQQNVSPNFQQRDQISLLQSFKPKSQEVKCSLVLWKNAQEITVPINFKIGMGEVRKQEPNDISANVGSVTYRYQPAPIPNLFQKDSMIVSFSLKSETLTFLTNVQESDLTCIDSEGNDLGPVSKRPVVSLESPLFRMPTSQFPPAYYQFGVGKLPSPSAKWFRIKGNIPVTVSEEMETTKPVSIPLRLGATATIDGIPIILEYRGGSFTNANEENVNPTYLPITITGNRCIDVIRPILTTTDGKAIAAKLRCAGGQALEYQNISYELSKSYETINIALEIWKSPRQIMVPVDFKIDLSNVQKENSDKP